MGSETFWGLVSLIVIVAFVAYAFYQDSKTKEPPQNGQPHQLG
jgi:hypothetical protein